MTWLIYTLIALVLWAIVNIIDKHVVSVDLRDEISVTRIFGLVMSFFFIIVSLFFEPSLLKSSISMSGLVAGLIYVLAIYFYYYAMRREEVSRFVPIVESQVVIASLAAFFLFNERFLLVNYVGIGLVLMGVFLISYKKEKRQRVANSIAFFIFLSIVFFVVRNLLFKYSDLQGHSFWVTIFWTGIGGIILPVIFSILPHPRLRSRGWEGVRHLTLGAVLSSIALVCFAKAVVIGSVSLASAVMATKPLLVFLLVLILSVFSPKIVPEPMTKKIIIQKIIATIVIVFGGILVVI